MIQSISKPASKSKLDISKVANKENEEKEPENAKAKEPKNAKVTKDSSATEKRL